MVARMRPWRLSEMFDPRGEARAIEGRSFESLSRVIQGAGQDIGGAFVRKRQEAESRRRADRDDARQDAEFSLRQEDLLERKRDRQAAETSLLDGLDLVADDVAATGQPTEQHQQVAQQLSDALGGPQETLRKVTRRASGSG